MTRPQGESRYFRRGSGPLHIVPDDGHDLTLCGTRVLQYLATRQVSPRPADDAPGWCAACRRHETAGTRRAHGGGRRR